MLVIVEGADNAGKTTLVNWLAKLTGMAVQHSGGPGKSPEEIKERCHRLLSMDNVIFDRFPLFSDRIYAPILRGIDNFSPELVAEVGRRLMQRKPLIIYCRPPRSVLLRLEDHQSHGHDTPEHIEAVKKNAEAIADAYDETMLSLSPLIYDYTADGQFQRNFLLDRIAHLRERGRLDLFAAVGDFQAKFDLPRVGNTPLGFPSDDVIQFREQFLREEVDEFSRACFEWDLPTAIDALVDIVYVALGTAHMFGVEFNEHFMEVHQANMRKERATSASDPRSTRPHALNVVKPAGWQGPDHETIIERTRLLEGNG